MSETDAIGGNMPVKDLEGISEGSGKANPAIEETSKKSGSAAGKRQKKIAVLTSGGDSAGMNAAGEPT